VVDGVFVGTGGGTTVAVGAGGSSVFARLLAGSSALGPGFATSLCSSLRLREGLGAGGVGAGTATGSAGAAGVEGAGVAGVGALIVVTALGFDALVVGRAPFPGATRFLGAPPGGVGACAGGVGIGSAGEEPATAP